MSSSRRDHDPALSDLANLSADEALGYFTIGVGDERTGQMGRTPHLGTLSDGVGRAR